MIGRLCNCDFRISTLNLVFGPNRITRSAILDAIKINVYATAPVGAWVDTMILDWPSTDRDLTREDEADLIAALGRGEQVFAPGESARALQNYTVTLLSHLTAGIILCPRIGAPRNLTAAEAQPALDEITFGRSVAYAVNTVVARALG